MKVIVLIFTMFFALQRDVKGNPLSNRWPVNIETSRVTRTVKPESTVQARSYNSWMPTFSISGLFKDEDDDAIAALGKKISALEKSQKEIRQLFKEFTEATKKTPCDAALAPGTSNDQTQGQPQNTKDEKGKEKVDATGDTKKDLAQSVPETTNGGSVGERKESTLTPIENDGSQSTTTIVNEPEMDETMPMLAKPQVENGLQTGN
ncbi:uncharacterized protein LOC143350313 [Colletes latitarsis]|uniref:uncharacterized protein LOC143350313 n=1 Tax=Colletes latitarsis TaxID=2605962 RepID=UPI0040351548